jgi:hypothetical protein
MKERAGARSAVQAWAEPPIRGGAAARRMGMAGCSVVLGRFSWRGLGVMAAYTDRSVVLHWPSGRRAVLVGS